MRGQILTRKQVAQTSFTSSEMKELYLQAGRDLKAIIANEY